MSVALASAVALSATALPLCSSGRKPDPPQTAITARAIATLIDIGASPARADGEVPFDVAPDGRRLAVRLSQADPDRNHYCQALIIVDIRTRKTRVIDRWEGFTSQHFVHGDNLAGMRNGAAWVEAPQWSPDGQSIAYLRPVAGRNQVHRISSLGGTPTQLTSGDAVERFTWQRPDLIIFATDGAVRLARDAIDKEGLGGYHYDGRFYPTHSQHPFPAPPPSSPTLAVDVTTKVSRPAEQGERDEFDDVSRTMVEGRVVADDRIATWLKRAPSYMIVNARLQARVGNEELTCLAAECQEVVFAAPASRSDAVAFLRKEGWRQSRLGLYRWNLQSKRVRKVTATEAVLSGCQATAANWICARESALAPLHLVRLDPATGRMETIFDPNPEFGKLAHVRRRRIEVRSSAGGEAFADIVFPPGHRRNARAPAIVVQYESRGFLRGGTGDEVPILALAAQGFVVISFQRPPSFAQLSGPPPLNGEEWLRRDISGWADRRQVLSALIKVMDVLTAAGDIDPERVGITGLSDGIGTILFGLLTTDRFAAAMMSTCCEDPVSTMTLQGPAFADAYSKAGYPLLKEHSTAFWKPYSLRVNADTVDTPILMQLADREYTFALESFEALREHEAPVELYVFPDEYHIKWQPAHRFAVYERTIRWFRFWLLGDQAPAGAPADETTRWQKMRSRPGR